MLAYLFMIVNKKLKKPIKEQSAANVESETVR